MKRFLMVFSFFVLGLAVFLIFINKESFLDPLSEKKSLKQDEKKVEVFGFLPTWMVGKTREYSSEVSHLIFLGVETDEEGNLIWDIQSKKINNDVYLKQKKRIDQNGGKNILGIKLFEDEKIVNLLKNEESIKNLVWQIKELLVSGGGYGFDGINLDFEYQGDPFAILNDDFGFFLDKLKEAAVGEISVDVFANTVIKGDDQKLKDLLNKIDHLVVMAYDFHRPGMDFAGPVAPVESRVGERNIREVVERVLGLNLDKNKIVMAYPLYGYEWKTYTKDFESKIKRGWFQMASWKRVNELIKEKNLVVNWDELSMSPWVVFEEEGEIRQIYFENEESLRAKLDLVKQNQLGGFGFWALGYEGDDVSVWKY